MKILSISIVMLTLCSCTWVDTSEEGANVRVVTEDELGSSCVRTGTSHVEVVDRIILQRAASNVMLELQALARNQAAERTNLTRRRTQCMTPAEATRPPTASL